jgi:hypothetical protein
MRPLREDDADQSAVSAPDRCACPECRTLDQLPERLQGIPDSWQMKLPMPKNRRRKAEAR